MSAITLNLPDTLLERLKARDNSNNLDQVVSDLLSRTLDEEEQAGGEGEYVIESDTTCWEDIPTAFKERMTQSIEAIKNGEEGIDLEDYIALSCAKREQKGLDNTPSLLS
jgi:hypothetical protein